MSLTLYNYQTYSVPLTLATMSFANTVSGYMQFPEKSVEDSTCNFPETLKDQTHPTEQRLKDLLIPSYVEKWFGNPQKPDEYLSLKKEDLRDKFLFLSGAEDYNRSLDPQIMLKLLKDINGRYDLKYKVVRSFNEICQEVTKAAEMGKLGNVLINAHSDSEGMCLSNCKSHEGWIHKFNDYSKCFEGLDPLGKITLFGSKTGAIVNGNPKDNLAQKLATDSKREVIAPIDYISSFGIETPNTADFELYYKNTKEEKKYLNCSILSMKNALRSKII